MMLKRDIQGKFALKNNDYRLVRSLRLTDETWKALGIVAECNGLTRADYLIQVAGYQVQILTMGAIAYNKVAVAHSATAPEA